MNSTMAEYRERREALSVAGTSILPNCSRLFVWKRFEALPFSSLLPVLLTGP